VSKLACGSKELDLSLSRFPLRGKAGAGRVPPTPRHVSCQPTTLALAVQRLPPQEGLAAPLCIPPQILWWKLLYVVNRHFTC
jgi:hypothetical protein